MDQVTGISDRIAELTPGADDWWRGAVIYQVYLRSFQDSDDDGIGDLQGLIDRLPYIRALGVDAIWIAPFFKSPMHDFGYDVADYRDVDPDFGTLSTFDRLLTGAHALGLKVLIDLVVSHTSEMHNWFIESRSSKDNPKADWYVWADAQPDGAPPNNWLSVFGGSAWEWEGARGQYYLHNFLISQPDLNFHNPDVRREVLDTVRFWLRRGVDGFRLDTVNFYFCDRQLRSNPPLPVEDRSADVAPSVNPYNFQDHIFDKNQPENIAFLRALRSVLDEFHGRMAMGEVGDAQRGLEIMGQYTDGDDLLHSCYAFDLLSGEPVTAPRVREILQRFLSIAPESWATWTFSNHDVVRHATRWGLSEAALRAVATLLMCLRGSVCLYQGEELGLTEAQLLREDIRDPYGIRFWPRFQGRDGCRTPMVWESEIEHGGFSGTAPWLPVSAAHLPLAAAAQEQNSDSLLHHYRRAIGLRVGWPVLRFGDLRHLRADGQILSFQRRHGGARLFCAFNLGDGAQEAALPEGQWTPVFGVNRLRQPGRVRLNGWDAIVAHDG